MYLLSSFVFSLITLEMSLAFLVENEFGSNTTSDQNTSSHSSSNQSIQDLMTLIVEEKRLRFKLEYRLNIMEDKFNQMDQFHNEVTKELLKERRDRKQLEDMYTSVKIELDNVTNILQSDGDIRGQLEDMYSNVKMELDNLTNVCDVVNKDIEKLDMQLHNNSMDLNYISQELVGLLQNASDKTRKIANNSLELTTIKDQFNVLTRQIANISGEIGNIPVGTEKKLFVGFSVGSGFAQSAVSSTRPLRFHSAIFNEDNVFNTSTGVFVCKQPGLYFFTFSFVHSHRGSHAHCCVYKNKGRSSLSCAVAGDTTSTAYSTGTTSGIMSLKEGDRVYVGECTDPSYLNIDTYLTGFLLKAN